MSEEENRLQINYVQVVASALAAVSSAVLLSTVGVAGTIIGAAIGSLFATAGSAIYSYSIRISRERVARAQAAAFARMQAARAGMPARPMSRSGAGRADGRADGPAEAEEPAPPEPKEPPAWREALHRLPWKWILIVATAVFMAVMVFIISFELISGRSVSTYTGGTGDGGHRTSFGFGHARGHSESPTPTPSPSTTAPSKSPSAGASTPASTPSATASRRPSGSPTPSSVGSAAPTPTPTPTPTPSLSATPSSSPTPSATASGTPSR